MSVSSAGRGFASYAERLLSLVTVLALVLLAAALTFATLLAATGHLPWPTIEMTFGGTAVPNAGMYAQIALTALAVGLLTFLPARARVMRLETSHRDFRMCMSDVAEAYAFAHAQDRAGVFTLSGEFDSMRERIARLRQHPDLGQLEPDLLELAAQMSYLSRELAEVYSDEKVARARAFLRQRQQEASDFEERIQTAHSTTREIRRWLDAVDMEESVAASQLARLREDLADLLPRVGMVVIAEEDYPGVALPEPEAATSREPAAAEVAEAPDLSLYEDDPAARQAAEAGARVLPMSLRPRRDPTAPGKTAAAE